MINSLYITKINADTITSDAVVFENIMFREGNIAYDTSTGIITLNQAGVYNINWWIALQTAKNSGGVAFSLVSSTGENIISNSPTKTGELNGLGVINVTTPPVNLTLRGANSGAAYLSDTVPIKAMLAINSASTSASTSESMLDFEYRQLANILRQLIILYPTSVMRAYAPGLYDIDGTPVSLYTSPEGDNAGIFTMLYEEQNESIPLNTIMAVKTGDATVYNPSISYLTPTAPFPKGWDTDVITAVHDFLPIGAEVEVYWGIGNSKAGIVYKNEYGMLVIADAEGNSPTFVLPTSSIIILQSSTTT
ncbi:MAG: hypothetical protein PHE93_04165 [Clostridia bacterium]|nr:hypothetical protein [Clostridia bacterium]